MSARVDRWRTRPRNVLIVAAGIAVVIGLAGWPRLTGYALGTVVAVCALWFGGRRLLTERRQLSHPRTMVQASAPEAMDESVGGQRKVVHGAREQLRKAVNGELCLCGNAGCTTPDAVIDAFATAHGSVVLRGGAGYLRYLGEGQAADHLEACARGGLPADDTAPRKPWPISGSSGYTAAQLLGGADLDDLADPDPSGPHPDAVRTDPDTTARATTDQAGHDPDTLRNRDALALRDDIRRACAAADGFTFDSLEPHDYQQHADAVLAVVQPQLDRLADYENRITWETTCGEHARLLDACRAADERADRAETAVAQVLAAAEVIETNGIQWAADSIRRAASSVTTEGSSR